MDKNRIIEISMVGLFVSIIAFILDQIGSSLGYWTYPYTLTPLERDLWAVADFSHSLFFYDHLSVVSLVENIHIRHFSICNILCICWRRNFSIVGDM